MHTVVDFGRPGLLKFQAGLQWIYVKQIMILHDYLSMTELWAFLELVNDNHVNNTEKKI